MTATKKAPSKAAPAAPETFASLLAQLSPQRQTFVLAYCEERSTTRAACAAGYSVKTAQQIGTNLLQLPQIQKTVMAWRRENAERHAFDHARYLKHLETLAYTSILAFRFDDQGEPIIVPGQEHLWEAVEEKKVRTTINRDGSRTVEVIIKLPKKVESARLLGFANGALDEPSAPPPAPTTVNVYGIDSNTMFGALPEPRQVLESVPAPQEPARLVQEGEAPPEPTPISSSPSGQ